MTTEESDPISPTTTRRRPHKLSKRCKVLFSDFTVLVVHAVVETVAAILYLPGRIVPDSVRVREAAGRGSTAGFTAFIAEKLSE